MSSLPLVRLPKGAAVYRFGTPASAPSTSAILRFPPTSWTIEKHGHVPQGWAIVGDAEGRRLAVETLLSRHRIQPITPPPGPFPYITQMLSSASTSISDSTGDTPSKPIRHLAFARPPTSGEFTDFTARYGALQEEDKLSFRETLASLQPPPSPSDVGDVARTMRIDHLLDLPMVSFSSGQTRRARIATAMLTKPLLLLLEDPMAGLDIPSRGEVSRVLGELNAAGSMRVVLVLRGKGAESMPEWITDVCEVNSGDVWLGSKAEWSRRTAGLHQEATINDIKEDVASESNGADVEPVIRLQDVSVSYGEGTRQVLKDITWSIRPGDRWHLQGSNGSGKTTLLSLILGHHPRSYSLPAESLTLFYKPRRSTPTITLRSMIGHTSPEIFASFPRGMGLTASEAIGTGYEGIFSRRNLTAEQKERVHQLLDPFVPLLRTNSGQSREEISRRPFAHFTPPQQVLLLFLRALVGKPPLLILDEPSQGMDEAIWTKCCQVLHEEWQRYPDQAVIVVSHYDDEVPWKKGRGKVLRLNDGHAQVI